MQSSSFFNCYDSTTEEELDSRETTGYLLEKTVGAKELNGHEN